ncbi:efflux RND transporter periplasmic adaptor subunit [Neptuniibacter sp.]|uniref:efflux RND transporter periplasmic adaptor subunit n=1 Tax=Neptuniibacter sp. TaxID=1962643 RepID=UPI00262AE9E4|nr:efflux RND transporter periplasmic adaptor subunit [Neptuniibacter sp.]MCP4596539.1 efflux RND transporter periplasmic adaptor subunit [Neptuniibacter sp.]
MPLSKFAFLHRCNLYSSWQLKPVIWSLTAALCFLLLIPTTVTAESVIPELEMRAQLSPKRFTTLSAEFGAKIKSISVLEGEKFKAKQTLIKFDCSLQAAQLRKAKAALAGAQNTLSGNQRLAKLGAIGNVELKNSQVEVTKARADISYLQTTLGKCSLYAPFSGRVEELKAQEQQYVQAGQPLLEIFDDSSLELVFIVPSRWLAWLKPNHQFNVHIDETGKAYPAKLIRTAAKVDPVSQSVKAFAVIDGKFNELMAGMSGRIALSPPKIE